MKKSRRLLGGLLAMVMTVLCFSGAFEALAGEEKAIVVESSAVYACGVPILIQKDSGDGQIYVYDQTGSTKLVETAITTGTTIYGGGKNTPVMGDTSIIIDGVSMSRVYGGGYSDGTGNADVSGSTSILVKGNCNAGTVFGGGYAIGSKGDASANVGGEASVEITAAPTSNHGYLHGGGYAQSGAYGASATAGSVSFKGVSRTYSVQGGGTATDPQNAASAVADVKGSIQTTLTGVDVREVYAAGSANGANARANAGSVKTVINGDEVMIFVGAGKASHTGEDMSIPGGVANVTGLAESVFSGCSNLYGYVYGGGNAGVGCTADTGSTKVTLLNSDAPASYDSMFSQWEAACVYGGGEASGAGSSAKVLGTSQVSVENSTFAGRLVGGGIGESGGDATTGDTAVTVDGMRSHKPTAAEQPTIGGVKQDDGPFFATVIAGGETDGKEGSIASAANTSLTVSNVQVEHIWGGVYAKGAPISIAGASALTVIGSQVSTDTITCFDTITLSSPLHLKAFLWKGENVPTKLIVTGLTAGDPVISCDDTDSAANWFSLQGGELAYQVDSTASIWKVGRFTQVVKASAGPGGTISPAGDTVVTKGGSVTFIVTPNEGYEVDTVLVDGAAASLSGNRLMLSSVTADHTVSATFRKKEIVLPKPDVTKEPGAPAVKLPDETAISDAVLTEEDKHAIATGQDVSVELHVKPVDTLSPEQQAKVEKVAVQSGKTVAAHLDIQLIKSVAGVVSEVTQLSAPVRLTIDIPAEFLAEGRKFAVVRTHAVNGVLETEVLPDLDDDPNTVTIETDRFSLYSLVYEDVKETGSQGEPGHVDKTDDIYGAPGTAGTMPTWLWAAVSVAAVGGVSLTFLRRKRPAYQNKH